MLFLQSISNFMDFISFIIGVIIGIMGLSARLRTIFFRMAMCCITAGYIIKTANPKLYIWHLKDYNHSSNYYIFLHSRVWWQSGLLVVSIYLILYWGFHFLIEKFITNKMDAKIKKMATTMDEMELQSFSIFMKKFMKKAITVLIKFRFTIPKGRVQSDSTTYFEIKNMFSSAFITSIHVLICSFMLNKVFSMNIYFLTILTTVLVLISIFLFYLVKIAPIFKHFKKIMLDIACDEYNAIIGKQ